MSLARLVLTAVVVERRPVAEVAAQYGVHWSWVYKLKARFEAEGEAAFEPRSRRSKTSPTAIPTATVELIIRLRGELAGAGLDAGLDAGPDTIAWHLAQHHHAPDQPAGTTTLQALLDRFVDQYNHHRPHRSLTPRATPGAV